MEYVTWVLLTTGICISLLALVQMRKTRRQVARYLDAVSRSNHPSVTTKTYLTWPPTVSHDGNVRIFTEDR